MTAVEAVGLTKRYRLGELKSQALLQTWARPIRRLLGREGAALPVPAPREMLALDDVSFSVERGEVVGVVGGNGAGKSTLLRILSRVTEPSGGHALVTGRVQSLLEVGTGFHPELTGRENVYLKGAIHGLPRSVVADRFEEIVDFSECGEFLDTPLKRWSSGMRVRLGFAVASLLPHDILVVDEVLAVGDARFRRRALDRITEQVHSEGSTVLFVSHDLDQIRDLCPRSILLKGGRLLEDGHTADVLTRYLDDGEAGASRFEVPIERSRVLRSVSVRRADGGRGPLPSGGGLIIEMVAQNLAGVPDLDPFVEIESYAGVRVARVRAGQVGAELARADDEEVTFACTLPSLPLVPGSYQLSVGLGRSAATGGWNKPVERLGRVLQFEVGQSDALDEGAHLGPRDGLVWFDASWSADG